MPTNPSIPPVPPAESASPRAEGVTGDTRTRILAAARTRLLAMGPAGLVIDAVARDARVSKGGLLHHFASKEELVMALLAEMVEGFDRVQDACVAGDSSSVGARTRAYLRSTVNAKGEPADGSAGLMAGIMASLGGDAARLRALRSGFERWQSALERDGIDPVRATLVRLAADGLWLSALLGFAPLEPSLGREVLDALDALTREP